MSLMQNAPPTLVREGDVPEKYYLSNQKEASKDDMERIVVGRGSSHKVSGRDTFHVGCVLGFLTLICYSS